MKFSIWHLLVLTVLIAVHLHFRTAIFVLPMCVGAYAACSMGISNIRLRSRLFTAIYPTVLLTIVFLVTDILAGLTTFLVTGQTGTQSTPTTMVYLVCLMLFAWTILSLVYGTIVGICVHYCALFIDVIRLGLLAKSTQSESVANQVVNPNRR